MRLIFLYCMCPQEDQLKSAKAEMGEVREENERLKLLLAKILKEYQSLQMHFFDILKQEEAKKAKHGTRSNSQTAKHHDQENYQLRENQLLEADQLVCLSLGKTSTADKSKNNKEEKKTSSKGHDEELDGGLELGLGCRSIPERSGILKNRANNSSSDNSSEEPNKEEDQQADQIWTSSSPQMPSNTQKTTEKSNGDDEVSQLSHVKKARVSVRARCDAPTVSTCVYIHLYIYIFIYVHLLNHLYGIKPTLLDFFTIF